MSSLTIDKLKFKAVKIKEYGIGFIQVKLSEDQVMNFYTDKIPKFSNVESPHNHQRHFKSQVLHGTIYENVYQVDQNGDQVAYCGCGNTDKEINSKFSILGNYNKIYKANDIYFRNKSIFHSVYADNDTVTLVAKMGKDKHDAIVLSDKIEHMESKLTIEELWDIVENILKRNYVPDII